MYCNQSRYWFWVAVSFWRFGALFSVFFSPFHTGHVFFWLVIFLHSFSLSCDISSIIHLLTFMVLPLVLSCRFSHFSNLLRLHNVSMYPRLNHTLNASYISSHDKSALPVPYIAHGRDIFKITSSITDKWCTLYSFKNPTMNRLLARFISRQ